MEGAQRERQRFDSLDASIRERFLAGDMNPDIVGIALRRPDYSSWLLDESSAAVQSNVMVMADRLARIRQLAEAYGARVIVVSIPNWPYVSHSAALRRIGFALNGNMLSTDAPDDEARQACREAGIEQFVSVTDSTAGRGGGRSLLRARWTLHARGSRSIRRRPGAAALADPIGSARLVSPERG
jgi:hypothetical protein